MKIVISDSSVLMDLAKTELIEPVLALPFEFMIPDVMLARELLDLGRYKPEQLVRLGFKVGRLDGTESAQAITYFRRYRLKLSLNDCFAWRLAEVHQGILMTGDGDLRNLAGQNGVEVHGVLWAIELMSRHATCQAKRLVDALDQLDGDPLVRLPKKPSARYGTRSGAASNQLRKGLPTISRRPPTGRGRNCQRRWGQLP